MKRLFTGALIALFVLMIAIVAMTPAPVVTLDELIRRCRENHPAWPSYQEDVKGQIGAGPVAEWSGELRAVRQTKSGIEAEYRLDPPWSGYECALPILLRDTQGKVVQGTSTSHDGGKRVYVFPAGSTESGGIPPWIELQWPHTVRRITLDAQGKWNAPNNAPESSK